MAFIGGKIELSQDDQGLQLIHDCQTGMGNKCL